MFARTFRSFSSKASKRSARIKSSTQNYDNSHKYQQPNYSHNNNYTSHNHNASVVPPMSLIYLFSGYMALINGAAVALFFYDKRQALSGGWRVPEKQLQLTALMGGWIGGLWAVSHESFLSFHFDI